MYIKTELYRQDHKTKLRTTGHNPRHVSLAHLVVNETTEIKRARGRLRYTYVYIK